MVDCDYHYDLSKSTPTEFLEKLRKAPEFLNKPRQTQDKCPKKYLAMCKPVDSNWITKADISFLIPYLDSNSVIAIPVYSTLASITIDNHGQSTLANEAYALIQGFRTGHYPPYSSIPLGGHEYDTFKLQDSLKEETLTWWATVQNKK
ncbi:MAG TPA: hypothetical protein VEC12_00325 [Bacteroidia bacterium]|nr:hypothetical protein [Bacteroidia bacterium]